jgi:hypothetical protein
MQDQVDWGFIAEKEGNKTSMYVPNKDGKVLGTSGATIGMGIDLGHWTKAKLEGVGVPAALVTKLAPYGGKKKEAAKTYVAANPLTLTTAEINSLNKAVKGEILKEITTQFDKDSTVKFKTLTPAKQTAIASVFFQYGMNKKRKGWPTNYWNQVTTSKWDEATKNLRQFGDDYKTRRASEADLLDNDPTPTEPKAEAEKDVAKQAFISGDLDKAETLIRKDHARQQFMSGDLEGAEATLRRIKTGNSNERRNQPEERPTSDVSSVPVRG